jgi:hypothetical protein
MVVPGPTSVCLPQPTVEPITVDISSSLTASDDRGGIETAAACRRLNAAIDESATDGHLADERLYSADL